jgi:SAM-dependent methyltransferase
MGKLAAMADQPTSVAPAANGAETPEYGAFYYRHDCGIPYERNEHWLGFFGEIADGIVRTLHPSRVLDAGCAMGFLVEALTERAVDAHGIDVSEYAISQVDESVRDRCKVGSLAEPLEGRYDLIVSIEVLEHIPASETDRVIANLCAASDRILLSTTPLDYGEATHLNVQPPEAWAALMAREGFLRDVEHDFSFITPWAALYVRGEEPLPETVRRYDRALWRLRQESSEVRTALLETQEKLAETEEKAEIEERSELGAEIDRLKEENLRLRDRLIGKDVELGNALGQVALLESQSQRIANVYGKVQRRMPLLFRIAGAVLRRARALGRG